MKKKKLPPQLQEWVDARVRHSLSHAHVMMARELGMNPKKLGKIDNHHQEPWKVPLPEFIEELYLKQFGKDRPDNILSIEAIFAKKNAKKAERKERRLANKQAAAPSSETSVEESQFSPNVERDVKRDREPAS